MSPLVTLTPDFLKLLAHDVRRHLLMAGKRPFWKREWRAHDVRRHLLMALALSDRRVQELVDLLQRPQCPTIERLYADGPRIVHPDQLPASDDEEEGYVIRET